MSTYQLASTSPQYSSPQEIKNQYNNLQNAKSIRQAKETWQKLRSMVPMAQVPRLNSCSYPSKEKTKQTDYSFDPFFTRPLPAPMVSVAKHHLFKTFTPGNFDSLYKQGGPFCKILEQIIQQKVTSNTNRPYIIAFTGPPGAGKTTGADLAAAMLKAKGFRVKKIEGDGYYLPREIRVDQHLTGLAEVDTQNFFGSMNNLRNGTSADIPMRDVKTGKIASHEKIDPSQYNFIVVEGCFTGVKPDLIDTIVYFDRNDSARLVAKTERDFIEKKRPYNVSCQGFLDKQIFEQSYVVDQAKNAKFYINISDGKILKKNCIIQIPQKSPVCPLF